MKKLLTKQGFFILLSGMWVVAFAVAAPQGLEEDLPALNARVGGPQESYKSLERYIKDWQIMTGPASSVKEGANQDLEGGKQEYFPSNIAACISMGEGLLVEDLLRLTPLVLRDTLDRGQQFSLFLKHEREVNEHKDREIIGKIIKEGFEKGLLNPLQQFPDRNLLGGEDPFHQNFLSFLHILEPKQKEGNPVMTPEAWQSLLSEVHFAIQPYEPTSPKKFLSLLHFGLVPEPKQEEKMSSLELQHLGEYICLAATYEKAVPDQQENILGDAHLYASILPDFRQHIKKSYHHFNQEKEERSLMEAKWAEERALRRAEWAEKEKKEQEVRAKQQEEERQCQALAHYINDWNDYDQDQVGKGPFTFWEAMDLARHVLSYLQLQKSTLKDALEEEAALQILVESLKSWQEGIKTKELHVLENPDARKQQKIRLDLYLTALKGSEEADKEWLSEERTQRLARYIQLAVAQHAEKESILSFFLGNMEPDLCECDLVKNIQEQAAKRRHDQETQAQEQAEWDERKRLERLEAEEKEKKRCQEQRMHDNRRIISEYQENKEKQTRTHWELRIQNAFRKEDKSSHRGINYIKSWEANSIGGSCLYFEIETLVCHLQEVAEEAGLSVSSLYTGPLEKLVQAIERWEGFLGSVPGLPTALASYLKAEEKPQEEKAKISRERAQNLATYIQAQEKIFLLKEISEPESVAGEVDSFFTLYDEEIPPLE